MKYIGLFDEKEDIVTKEKLDAVEAAIPTKTSQLDNDSGFIKSSQAPVQSVNNKTGAVSLTANDVGAVSKTGDTMTGNLTVGLASLETNGYVTGTWLKTIANIASSSAASQIAVINDGWVYSRTTEQIKSDIGLGNVDNVKQYSATNPPPYPVTSVNGKTGAVTVREVPSVTASDNGKFLRVVNGAWASVEIENANGGSF